MAAITTSRRHARAAAAGVRGDAQHVDAVLLAADGEPWLPRALTALAAQTRRPDSVTTFDAASHDETAQILADFAAETGAQAHRIGRRASLLDVAALTTATVEARALTSRHDYPDSWLWLLHDDSAPAPDALEQLVAAVEIAPSVGIAGCKLLDWDDPTLLREAGFATSVLGRPLTGVERGETDQGQRDHADDVLAVSTAGMLVRADLLAALGSDPALPVVGDALDLCRRARLARARVIVVPSAVVHHADASAEGLRRTPASRSPRAAARRAAVHTRLVTARRALLPGVVLAVLAGGLLRALARVAVKQPDRAVGEIVAVVAVLARPGRIVAARRSAARTSIRSPDVLRPLLVPSREVWRWHRDRWQHLRRPALDRPASDALDRPALDRPASDTGPRRRGVGVLVALMVVLAAVDVTTLRPLLGPGDVVGGALLPAPSWRMLWDAAGSSWSPAGLGTAQVADPWLRVLALLAAPTAGLGGDAGLAVRGLLLTALPLAGLGGWLAAGYATPRRRVRTLAALTWAASPSLLEAITSGRLGAVVAHLALPAVGIGLARLVRAPTRRLALPAAAGTGLAASVVVCGAPVLLPALLVVFVVVALTARRWVSALLWSALAPVTALGPFLGPALVWPVAWVTSPGAPLRTAPAAAWLQLLGLPAAMTPSRSDVTRSVLSHLPSLPHLSSLPDLSVLSGLSPGLGVREVPALLTGACALVVALVAVGAGLGVRRRGGAGRVARAGMWCAATGLATAVVATALGGSWAWTGPACSVLVAGFGVAGLGLAVPVSGSASASGPLPAPTRRAGIRLLAIAAIGALAVLPLAELAAWGLGELPSADAGAGGVARSTSTVAAVARDGAASPDAVRTMTIGMTTDGALQASVARGQETLAETSTLRLAADIGAGRRGSAAGLDPAQRAVSAAAATLVGGTADARRALTDLGVGFVLVADAGTSGSAAASAAASAASASASATASADVALVADLDAAPGLVRAGGTDHGILYRVLPESLSARPARARLVDASGATLAVLPSRGVNVGGRIPAAPSGTVRTLVLAERSDSGWHAKLDGQALQRGVHDGWAVAFIVPAGGGTLSVTHTTPVAAAWDTVQVTVLGLTALLALPVPPRRRGER